MIYTFDTEFIEDGSHLDLISIGIACQDGRSFYAESREVDWSRASDWVLENVRPHLEGRTSTRTEIADSIREFVGDDKPTFFAYYAATDWLCFYRLYGRLIDIPKSWPKICFDLKQWQLMAGNPKLPPAPGNEHNAVADAKWNLEVYKLLAERDPASAQRLVNRW